MLAAVTRRRGVIRGSRHLRRLEADAGGSLVEYALVTILFMTILFGIGGFAHMLYVYHFVDHSAKEAARWASVNGFSCNDDAPYSTNGNGSCTAPVKCAGGSCTECTTGCTYAKSADITNFVQMVTPSGVDSTKIAVTATWPGDGSTFCTGTNNGPSCPVQVQVSYAFNFILPLLPSVRTTTAPCNKPGFCLSSTSQMVIAH